MKKLLIVNNNMHLGGIQKALLNLLREIKDDYDITLFLFSEKGELNCEIPQEIRVIYAGMPLRVLGLSLGEARKDGILSFAIRGICALYTKAFSNALPLQMLSKSKILKNEKFDFAVSYLICADAKVLYGGGNEFVLNSVCSERKIAFIHGDFENFEGNNAYNRKIYRCFDRLAGVSESCSQKIIRVMPDTADKTYTVYNCTDTQEIQRNASAENPGFSPDTFNIVTVARISAEKGLFRALIQINRLAAEGYSIKWHIIGDGGLYSSLRQKTAGNNSVILYGAKKNPYPYMAAAELFLLPSFHEAAPVVFDEAYALSLPVLTTDTTSARELVEKRNAGIVCENSGEGIYTALKSILDDKGQLEKCRAEHQPGNKKAKQQFAKLLNDKSDIV